MTKTSPVRMIAGLILASAAVVWAESTQAAGPSLNWRWERFERITFRNLKHLLTVHALKGDSGTTPVESRWFVLLLRDRNVKGRVYRTGYNLKFSCTVQYLKFQGPDKAANAILDFLASAEPFHVRDFKVKQFVVETNADTCLALEKAADMARGGRPAGSDSANPPGRSANR